MLKKWVLILGVVSLMPTFLLGGCIDNDKSLTLVGNISFDDECEVTTSDDYIAQLAGTLDVNYPGFNLEPFYSMNPRIRNNMSCECGGPVQDTEVSFDVQFERIEVRYSFIEGAEIAQRYPALVLMEDMEQTVYLAGTVESQGTSTLAGVTILPPQIGSLLVQLGEEANDVVIGASIRVIGQSLGGRRVESNEYIYPIYLCWGCLSGVMCPDGSPMPSCTPGRDGNWLPEMCPEVE